MSRPLDLGDELGGGDFDGGRSTLGDLVRGFPMALLLSQPG